jgi:hypothetical protein
MEGSTATISHRRMEFQNELVFTSCKAFASGSSRGCIGAHRRDARLRSPRRRGVCVRVWRRRRSRRRFARARRRVRSPDRPLSLWSARIRTRLRGLACGARLLGRASGLGMVGRPRLRPGPWIRRGWPRLCRRRWPRRLWWWRARWRRSRGSRSLIDPADETALVAVVRPMPLDDTCRSIRAGRLECKSRHARRRLRVRESPPPGDGR